MITAIGSILGAIETGGTFYYFGPHSLIFSIPLALVTGVTMGLLKFQLDN